MPPVDPTGHDLKRFLAEDDGGPVTMLNLLKFTPDGGRDSYNKYATAILPFLEKVGGTVVHFGETATPLVAPPTDTPWDAVLLVRYPSRQAFSAMVADPEYQHITHLRTEALDAAVLQPTVTPG
ncbi:hypothetical protein DSM104299_04229 [Baekduia alba]|uniref:DUF1330 domain-containing protein n=1 Tax=Baekduia alba TaxID=2997333 RepID=UPI00233FF311|nr:DUF1330 domain-containing protein [Baekduia alba]WCB95481.1 hypothetical protein DSM104299_04229 [Baekduia alba]